MTESTQTNINAPKVCDEGSPEWYAARSTGIGASEAGAVCGWDNYVEPLTVYYRKVIQRMSIDGAARDEIARDLEIAQAYVDEVLDGMEVTREMMFGTIVQPVIGQLFEYETGIKVLQSPVGMYRHPEVEWMLATPDALLEPDGQALRGGEWKSMGPQYASSLGIAKDSGELPAACASFHLQAQQQMETVNFMEVHFGILIGRRVVPFEVPRHDGLIDSIKKSGDEMWQRILNLDPPPAEYTHRNALQTQRALHDSIEDTRIEMSERIVEVVARRREAKKLIKDATEVARACDTEILEFIGNHTAAVHPDGTEMRREYRGEVEVKASVRKAHYQLHDRKYKGQPLRPSAPQEAIEDKSDAFQSVHRMLSEAGFFRYEFHAGSSYYIANSGSRRIRVSDHPPNQKTLGWMIGNGVEAVKINKDWKSDVKRILESTDTEPEQ